MTIWANTIVYNEENFIWFALMSVVDYVDKILVWDTGSTDKTVEIIKEVIKIKGSKVEFREVGLVNKFQFPKVRQDMLNKSDCDWILVLDGDEIWWEASIKQLIKKINTQDNDIEGIVVPMVVPVGDIYHFQEESAGQYQLLGRKGHLSLRAINRRIPGLHVDWPYGKESYLDENSKLIQNRKGIIFLDAPYLHVTHLRRSGEKRLNSKFKYEQGTRFPGDFRYPEIMESMSYPEIVPNPRRKRTKFYEIISHLKQPFLKIKRNINA